MGEMNYWTFFTSAVTVFVGFFAIVKVFFDLGIAFKSRNRDEYKFAKDFIADLNSASGLHPYLREKGCQIISGERRAHPKRIEYILSLPSDITQALHEYSLGRSYIVFSDSPGSVGGFEFAALFKRKWVRFFVKFFYLVLWLIPALSSFWIPLVANEIFENKYHRLIFALTVFVVAMILLPILLRKFSKLIQAEVLMKRISSASTATAAESTDISYVDMMAD